MEGIYLIKNIVNNKVYIGMSNNIYKRWETHKNNAYNENCKEYDKVLYKAFRKYGLKKFTFQILEEETDLEIRKEKEKYWISYYDSYNNGYNETIGGDICEMQIGETHSNAKLSEKDVIDIRTRYDNKERCKEVYKLYQDKIDFNGFHKVWKGETWTHIYMQVYTKENLEFHKHNTGQKGSENGRSKLTEEDVYDIRLRKKNGESKLSVYEDYKDVVTKGSFTNIWCGYNWKHVVV